MDRLLRRMMKSFHQSRNSDMQALISTIRTTNSDELCLVKSTKKPYIVPCWTDCSFTLSCQNWTNSPQDTIFKLDELATWPSGLEVHETITTVKEGGAAILYINVTNNTNHDIVLPGRVVLGRLHLVRLVTPVEVRFKDPETLTPDKELPCRE